MGMGMPMAIPVMVAAGNGPMAAARPLTKLDIFSSAAPPKAPAMAAPGSATAPIVEVAEESACEAELIALAPWLAFCIPAAMACFRSAGGGRVGFCGRYRGRRGFGAVFGRLERLGGVI